MHIHRSLAAALLAGSLLLSTTLRAQVAPTVPTPQTLEEANAQRARAEQMRDAAERNFLVEQDACYDKFQVNSCLDDAKKRRTRTLIDARNLDIPARDFQREAKRADVEAKEQKRDDDAPRRAAKQQQQAADYRAEEAAKAAKREKKIADKAAQAAKGRQNAAADQARQRESERKIADKERQAAEGRKKTAAEQADREKKELQRAERAAKKAKEAAKP